jgi:hypothetical protein
LTGFLLRPQHALQPGDRVALEATTNCWAVADALTPHVAKVVVSNPMSAWPTSFVFLPTFSARLSIPRNSIRRVSSKAKLYSRLQAGVKLCFQESH